MALAEVDMQTFFSFCFFTYYIFFPGRTAMENLPLCPRKRRTAPFSKSLYVSVLFGTAPPDPDFILKNLAIRKAYENAAGVQGSGFKPLLFFDSFPVKNEASKTGNLRRLPLYWVFYGKKRQTQVFKRMK